MDPILGMIIIFGGNFAPRGWALCDGSLLPISQNQALFSILGTTYGGDGVTTFGLPDLRGRVPLSFGQAPGLSGYSLGEKSGAESVTLTQAQMPQHAHEFGIPCSTGGADVGSPVNAVAANLDPTLTYASSPTPGANMTGGQSFPSGSNQAHDNRQPSLCVNFIIATEGIFPSRN